MIFSAPTPGGGTDITYNGLSYLQPGTRGSNAGWEVLVAGIYNIEIELRLFYCSCILTPTVVRQSYQTYYSSGYSIRQTINHTFNPFQGFT